MILTMSMQNQIAVGAHDALCTVRKAVYSDASKNYEKQPQISFSILILSLHKNP